MHPHRKERELLVYLWSRQKTLERFWSEVSMILEALLVQIVNRGHLKMSKSLTASYCRSRDRYGF